MTSRFAGMSVVASSVFRIMYFYETADAESLDSLP
jgi:hypothetical protein